MDETVKVIRSLLLLERGGLTLDELNKEYKSELGETVPFKKFGFDTLQAFLRSTDQFRAIKTLNGLKIMAKVTEQSAHIVKMRQEQNISASERKRKKKMATSRVNASLGRSNVMSKPKGANTSKKNSPMRRMARPAGNNMHRITSLAPRQALVAIPINRPSNSTPGNVHSSVTTQNHNLTRNIPNQNLTQNMKPVQNENSRQNIKVTVTSNGNASTNGNASANRNTSTKVSTKLVSKLKQKLDLHARFVPKQIEQETRPVTPPLTKPSPETTKFAEQSLKLDLQSRLIAKQPDIEPKTPVSAVPKPMSPSYTPLVTPPIKSRLNGSSQTPIFYGANKRVNLCTPSPMKLLQPVEQVHKESTPSPVVPSNRSKLFKIFEDIVEERKQEKPTENTLEKPKLSTRLVSFKPQPVIFDSYLGKSNGLMHDTSKPNLHSRLQSKQTELGAELDQIGERVRQI